MSQIIKWTSKTAKWPGWLPVCSVCAEKNNRKEHWKEVFICLAVVFTNINKCLTPESMTAPLTLTVNSQLLEKELWHQGKGMGVHFKACTDHFFNYYEVLIMAVLHSHLHIIIFLINWSSPQNTWDNIWSIIILLACFSQKMQVFCQYNTEDDIMRQSHSLQVSVQDPEISVLKSS